MRPGPRPPAWAVAVAGCAAAALASLAVPATLGYDPWAWLVWGREVGRWSLDTTGGPSWKPLPVAVTTVLAPLGDVAVPAVHVVARTGSLLAVAAVWQLGRRLAGPWAALLGAVLLVVTPDGDPRFVRLVLEGHEAPWSAGLACAALLALVERRAGQARWWTWLLALLRPEAWPFLLALVAWGWWEPVRGRARRSARSCDPGPPARRSFGLAALASIPLLWFVPDWIGSGSPFHGAGTAQVLADEPTGARLADSLQTFAGIVPLPVWALAALGVVIGWRGGDRVRALLASAALAWSALVVAMAGALGYAAISRFFLPSAAVVCVLAGAGALDVSSALRRWGGIRAAVASTVAVAVGVGLVAPRAAAVTDVVAEVRDRGELADDLHEVIDRSGGADVLARCGAAVVTARTLLRSAAAWELDVPLDAVERAVPDRRAVLLLESRAAAATARATPGTVALASVGRWDAFAARCPEVGGR